MSIENRVGWALQTLGGAARAEGFTIYMALDVYRQHLHETPTGNPKTILGLPVKASLDLEPDTIELRYEVTA